MIIKNTNLLRYFRGKGRCDYCGERCNHSRHAAHIWPRGRGRLDIAINLCSLGGPWDCRCHDLHHERKSPTEDELYEVVAKRYRISVEQVKAEIEYVRSLDKYAEYDPKARLQTMQEAYRTGVAA